MIDDLFSTSSTFFSPSTPPRLARAPYINQTKTPPLTQIDRALRDVNRICQADDVLTAWRADRVFTRPAIRRVVEAKASARRLAARRFKAHMRWVMARRERGF